MSSVELQNLTNRFFRQMNKGRSPYVWSISNVVFCETSDIYITTGDGRLMQFDSDGIFRREIVHKAGSSIFINIMVDGKHAVFFFHQAFNVYNIEGDEARLLHTHLSSNLLPLFRTDQSNINKDATTFFSAADYEHVKLYDVHKAAPIKEYKCQKSIMCFTYNQKWDRLIVLDNYYGTTVIDAKDGKCIFTDECDFERHQLYTLTPDIVAMPARDGRVARLYYMPTNTVRAVQFHMNVDSSLFYTDTRDAHRYNFFYAGRSLILGYRICSTYGSVWHMCYVSADRRFVCIQGKLETMILKAATPLPVAMCESARGECLLSDGTTQKLSHFRKGLIVQSGRWNEWRETVKQWTALRDLRPTDTQSVASMAMILKVEYMQLVLKYHGIYKLRLSRDIVALVIKYALA